jgi:hypothetical protein
LFCFCLDIFHFWEFYISIWFGHGILYCKLFSLTVLQTDFFCLLASTVIAEKVNVISLSF